MKRFIITLPLISALSYAATTPEMESYKTLSSSLSSSLNAALESSSLQILDSTSLETSNPTSLIELIEKDREQNRKQGRKPGPEKDKSGIAKERHDDFESMNFSTTSDTENKTYQKY